MTLDFKKMIRNNVAKEATVHHWDGRFEIFRRDELPENVSARIREDYGETFLDDANFMLFFSAPGLDKEMIEKYIFKIVNSVLGKSANDLTEGDIKSLDLGNAPETARVASGDDGSGSGLDGNSDAVRGVLDAEIDESVENPEPGEKFCFLKITMK